LLTYQCNICRHTISLAENENIGKCPQCGSLFVVPNQFRDNANKQNIYRLAAEALASQNFDVALTYYKRILMVDAKETAAHWGFLLSKYGVEISEKSDTYQHVIFHRMEHAILTDDPSYEKMIAYCPREALYYYQGLSRIIASQQQKMLAISQAQQPYDIYINCTSEPGTHDYLLANQVGIALDNAGYRVFLPATMLSGVPASEKNLYEMAVAEKAQTMIVIVTTQTDHSDSRYTAVWKRFLAYRRQDAGRKMLSVFRDINPQQLPMELQPLQSIKDEHDNIQETVLTEINKMFGRTSQDASVTRQIMAHLRQAEVHLAAGKYSEAAALCRQVRALDAEEVQAHWGLVRCATQNLTVPVFSDEVNTDYQHVLQFSKSPQREQYQKTMCSLMAEPSWNRLMELTGNLNNTQTLSRKDVQDTIADVRKYHSKDDPRLGKIEDFYTADKIRRETAELKNAYERRDVLVEPLFAEQGKAENGYNSCSHGYGDLVKPFNRAFNFLFPALLFLFAGQLSLTYSSSHGIGYDGFFFNLSVGLFFAAVLIVGIVLARAVRLILDALDIERYFGILIVAVLLIASWILFRKHNEILFLIYIAILILLWLAEKIVTMVISGNIRRNAHERKAAAKRVAHVNQQIQESYQRAMRAHFAKYGIENPTIPAYTVKNSDGFYIRPEKKYYGTSIFSLLGVLLILLVMVLGATTVSNRIYTEGWEDIATLSSGGYHIVGLREDGTCVANGKNNDGQCEVAQWKDVKQISAGRTFTAALFEDGTVAVACADSERFAAVRNWRDIVQIDASNDHVLALRKDGTCVAAGCNDYGESDVGEWENISIIRAVTNGIGSISIGVTEDGLVLATAMPEWDNVRAYLLDNTGIGEDRLKVTSLYGDYAAMIGMTDDNVPMRFGANPNNQLSGTDNWDFTEIRQLYIGDFTVGLKQDGTAIFAGNDAGTAAQISTWRNVASMSGSASYVLGLTADGHVYSAGNNDSGQCNVDEWENIRKVYAGDITSYGIREDGTVAAAGYSMAGLSYLSPKNPIELLSFWLSFR